MKLFLSLALFVLVIALGTSCATTFGQSASRTTLSATVMKQKGYIVTTINTPRQQLLLFESDGTGKSLPPAVIMQATGTTESKCYTCYRQYYDCIFNGGKNCATIGNGCDAICKAERGAVYAPATSFAEFSRKITVAQ